MAVPVTGWAARRLNHLIAARGYTTYLEIGVSRGLTFLEVQAPSMIAVDPEFRFNHRADRRPGVQYNALTSDAYFAGPGAGASFDLALIDGLHTFEQTLRDLLNVLPRLRPGGAVLIDDTVPTDRHSALRTPEEAMASRLGTAGQRTSLVSVVKRAVRAARGAPAPVRKVSGAWHGDVYKVVVFLHDYLTDWDFVTLRGPGGNPQTLVWHAPGCARAPLAARIADIDTLSFEAFTAMRPSLPEAPDDAGLARCLAAGAGPAPDRA